jgi:hypothetical protein
MRSARRCCGERIGDDEVQADFGIGYLVLDIGLVGASGVQGTADGQAVALEDVSFDFAQDAGVDHGGLDIPSESSLASSGQDGAGQAFMPWQFLHLTRLSRPAARAAWRTAFCPARGTLIQVLAAGDAGTRVSGELIGGENVLPKPSGAWPGV